MIVCIQRYDDETRVQRWFADGETPCCPSAKPHIRPKFTRWVAPYHWKNYGYALVAEGDRIRVRAIR